MTAPSHSYHLFDRLFELTRDKLYSFVLKHTRNKHLTEDILQHCYMKLWEHLETVDVDRVENLLFTYARNAVIDHVRKKQSSVVLLSAVEEEQASTVLIDKQLEYAELSKQVNALIDRMPAKRKQVFVLVREYGLSYEEVSQRLGISKLTIKKHMNEALRFLRKEAVGVYGTSYVLLVVLKLL
jgi:RNA polymerase sigma-70 factor (ECF subfamily)